MRNLTDGWHQAIQAIEVTTDGHIGTTWWAIENRGAPSRAEHSRIGIEDEQSGDHLIVTEGAGGIRRNRICRVTICSAAPILTAPVVASPVAQFFWLETLPESPSAPT